MHALAIGNCSRGIQVTVRLQDPDFRRFRNTYLRNDTSCPDGLRRFGWGIAGGTMTDLDDRVREHLQFRLKWAEKCGIGFDLPESGL